MEENEIISSYDNTVQDNENNSIKCEVTEVNKDIQMESDIVDCKIEVESDNKSTELVLEEQNNKASKHEGVTYIHVINVITKAILQVTSKNIKH